MSDGFFLIGEVRSVKVRGVYSSCRVLAGDNFFNVSVKGDIEKGSVYKFVLAVPKIVEHAGTSFVSFYAFDFESLEGGE